MFVSCHMGARALGEARLSHRPRRQRPERRLAGLVAVGWAPLTHGTQGGHTTTHIPGLAGPGQPPRIRNLAQPARNMSG